MSKVNFIEVKAKEISQGDILTYNYGIDGELEDWWECPICSEKNILMSKNKCGLCGTEFEEVFYLKVKSKIIVGKKIRDFENKANKLRSLCQKEA